MNPRTTLHERRGQLVCLAPPSRIPKPRARADLPASSGMAHGHSLSLSPLSTQTNSQRESPIENSIASASSANLSPQISDYDDAAKRLHRTFSHGSVDSDVDYGMIGAQLILTSPCTSPSIRTPQTPQPKPQQQPITPSPLSLPETHRQSQDSTPTKNRSNGVRTQDTLLKEDDEGRGQLHVVNSSDALQDFAILETEQQLSDSENSDAYSYISSRLSCASFSDDEGNTAGSSDEATPFTVFESNSPPLPSSSPNGQQQNTNHFIRPPTPFPDMDNKTRITLHSSRIPQRRIQQSNPKARRKDSRADADEDWKLL